ncbi:23S rRNA pseudouridine(1911/1915/1917) synthase RluD [Thiosocius teredinicola]|uniref:23S rRNA pseudouridine(1911/1915/1917) synthase RluD n=1 Tax=Thiosocius teredinicola TaxID=1973002 RepID=UPI002FE4F39D
MTDQNHDENLLENTVGPDLAGARLDQALATLFPDFSRSRLQAWTRDGRVLVNGEVRRPRDKVASGDRLQVRTLVEDQVACVPQPIPLNIVFEDEHILVVNKPADLVVHPAAGNPDGTLQNGLLYHNPSLIELPRAGIVHRLDKDTTGLMVIAKSQAAHKRLVDAIAARQVTREYRALVVGSMPAGGTIDLPIGRHPTQRTRMAVNPLGKPSVTHFRVLEHFRGHTLLKVLLETGRTHQIRVHMAHLRHPVFGDPVYGRRLQLPAGASEELKGALRGFKRQALHAKRLQLDHPVTGRPMRFECAIPDDMRAVIDALAADANIHWHDPDYEDYFEFEDEYEGFED